MSTRRTLCLIFQVIPSVTSLMWISKTLRPSKLQFNLFERCWLPLKKTRHYELWACWRFSFALNLLVGKITTHMNTVFYVIFFLFWPNLYYFPPDLCWCSDYAGHNASFLGYRCEMETRRLDHMIHETELPSQGNDCVDELVCDFVHV